MSFKSDRHGGPIIEETQRYPYLLQEWGKHAWDADDASPIDVDDVERANGTAIATLDGSFFRVRFDRLTPLIPYRASQSVRKSSSRMKVNVSHDRTPTSLHTSGIWRLARCRRGLEISVVTMQWAAVSLSE